MRLVRMLIVSTFVLGAGAGFAHAADTDFENQIAAASTPAQHEELASEYRAQATEAREKAEKHRRMAKRYEQGKSVLSQAGHCNSLAKRYEENAKDYDALADAEAAEAKK